MTWSKDQIKFRIQYDRSWLISQTTFDLFNFESRPPPVGMKTKIDIHASPGFLGCGLLICVFLLQLCRPFLVWQRHPHPCSLSHRTHLNNRRPVVLQPSPHHRLPQEATLQPPLLPHSPPPQSSPRIATSRYRRPLTWSRLKSTKYSHFWKTLRYTLYARLEQAFFGRFSGFWE